MGKLALDIFLRTWTYEVEVEVSVWMGVTVATVVVSVNVAVVEVSTVLKIYVEQNRLALELYLESRNARRTLSATHAVVEAARFTATSQAAGPITPGIHAGAGIATETLANERSPVIAKGRSFMLNE